MIITNLTLLVVFSMLYVVGLSYLYFSKVRMNNGENKIYKIMLVLNLFGLILQLLCDYVSLEYNNIPVIISDIILRVYLCYFIAWISLMILYLIEVTFEHKSKARIITVIIATVQMLLLFILPYELYRDVSNRIYYTYGDAVQLTFMCSGIMSSIIFFILIIKRKQITSKKALPIYLFLMFGLGTMVVQMIHPELVITTVMETLICCLMYFTIENPDMKMIEQLTIARISAEKANLAKSDFLSSMSHEIRTPLNAIVGLSEDIASYKDRLPKEVVEDSSDIINASNTLLEIVGNILDINKIESEKLEIVETTYNPKKEIESLAKVLATRIGDKQINFKVNFAPDLPYELSGDKIHIKQIVNNLLSNAIKYTEYGEINLNIKCINKNDSCLLIISVQDTGRGIKAEYINKLFTKFERLDIEKNTTTEGTGLGLAITKKLVELMGGNINVQSQFGKGSIFIVQISQKIIKQNVINNSQELNQGMVESSIKNNETTLKKKVLLVDDNMLNIKVARISLKNFNFIIDECYNGIECLNKIKSGEKYDLILMDIMMPVMSGETAIKELQKIKGFNTPVIALTADAMEGAKEKYTSEGFVDYIAKPFTRETIEIKLKKIFKSKTKQIDWSDVPEIVIGTKNDRV